MQTPDFDKVWASATKIVTVAARSRRQNATPMEARGGHAAYDAATGRVTLTCTTQMPHLTRTAIADVLGIAESELRVIAPDVGGGFGQKMSLAAEYVLLVWLARKLKSTVAWREDRRENLIAGFHSRDQYLTLQAAFDKNAKLFALKPDVVANVGAYSCYPTTCGVEPLMAMAEMPGPYDFRAYSCRARGVVTNTCTMAPYRGVSRPVLTFALERAMDKAAAAFGLDPVDIRRRNLIEKFPYTSVDRLGVRRGKLQTDAGNGGAGGGRSGLPPAAKGSAHQGPLSRHRLCHLLRAHRLRQFRIRRARRRDRAGLGDGDRDDRPVRLRRGAHRLLAARPGTRHRAGADHRRRDRRRSAKRSR